MSNIREEIRAIVNMTNDESEIRLIVWIKDQKKFVDIEIEGMDLDVIGNKFTVTFREENWY